MRALIIRNRKLYYEESYPEPVPGEADALIRVTMAGICNTDLEILKGYKGFSGVPGHEFSGLVEDAPDRSLIGKRVTGQINCGCGRCPTCISGFPNHCPKRTALGITGRDGAFAELCTLPAENLHILPDVPDKVAVFTEPLAAALEITEKIHIRPSEKVIITGDGKLGLLAAQVIRLTGCSLLVVGHHRDRLDFLEKQNIKGCLESDLSGDEHADLVVECTGSPGGFDLARRLVRPCGRIVLKSTFQGSEMIDMNPVVVNEISLLGSRCGPFAPAINMLTHGLVRTKELVDSVFSLENGVEAFERAGTGGALKVLVRI